MQKIVQHLHRCQSSKNFKTTAKKLTAVNGLTIGIKHELLLSTTHTHTLILFQAWQTHASYNSDPGHHYKLRVIPVNRLSQVLAHRDKFKSFRTESASYRLKDSVVSMPYIAFNARQRQHSVLVTDNSVMYWRTVWPLPFDLHNRLIGHAVENQQYLQSMHRLGLTTPRVMG